MPESPNEPSPRQRRANWVGLRTLRQMPKAVGETKAGDTVYEVRSVRLLLDGSGAHFVRATTCSRCRQEMAGAPVMTPIDLDRPLRPMICADCIRQAGVSTVWDNDSPEPMGLGPAAEPPAPVPAPAPPVEARAPEAAPAPAGEDDRKEVARLGAMEQHLRAVTVRVNELWRLAREEQSSAGAGESDTAALWTEVAMVRAAIEEIRTLAASVPAMRDEVARLGVERAAGGDGIHAEVARLAGLVEDLARAVAAMGETRLAVDATARTTRDLVTAQDDLERRLAAAVASEANTQLVAAQNDLDRRLAAAVARLDAVPGEEALVRRLGEAEGRLSRQLAAQWGELEAAIESSVSARLAGVVRAGQELAAGQAALEERLDTLAAQLATLSVRFDSMTARLQAAAFDPPAPAPAGVGTFLDVLDRQLDAAARRLAARSVGNGEN